MSLLSLPREIRDQIYLNLIKHEIKATDFAGRYCTSTFQLETHHAIFQVNRQIHYEASQTLYGLNSFAIGIDPYSPYIPQRLETLARLSLYRWVKKFVVKVSFLDGISSQREGEDRIVKLTQRDLLRRMTIRLKVLVKILCGISHIENLRIEWFLPNLKTMHLGYHTRLLGFLEPFSSRVRVAEVTAHASEADLKDGTIEWEDFGERLEGIGRALEGKEDRKAFWTFFSPHEATSENVAID